MKRTEIGEKLFNREEGLWEFIRLKIWAMGRGNGEIYRLKNTIVAFEKERELTEKTSGDFNKP